MTEPWWISLIVSWLPFIILIAVWVMIARRQGMTSRGPSGPA